MYDYFVLWKIAGASKLAITKLNQYCHQLCFVLSRRHCIVAYQLKLRLFIRICIMTLPLFL